MWIATKFGFFSINNTAETPARCLQVRARVQSDLESLSEALESAGWAGLRITHTPHADYQFRANVHYAALAEIVSQEIRSIDYSNFKDTVANRDPKRAKIYSRVWAVLLDIAFDRSVADYFSTPSAQRRLFGTSSIAERLGYGSGNDDEYFAAKERINPECAAKKKRRRRRNRRKSSSSPAA